MLGKKQIEEMSEEIARMLCEAYTPDCDEYQPHTCSKCYVNSTPIGIFAEMLCDAGYRKQEEGEWKLDKYGNGWCSVCNHCGFLGEEEATEFCPNCGAKMKGGAE